MTNEMLNEGSSIRVARPRTYAPVGTSAGILGFVFLSVGIPLTSALCASPWVHDGFGLIVDSFLYAVLGAVAVSAVLVAGLRSHAYWNVCYFFGVGAIMLAAYPLAVAIGLAVPLGLIHTTDRDLQFANTMGLLFMAALAPFWYLLLRALRLRYWQPWTRPEQWETGDEQASPLAVAVTSTLSPAMNRHFAKKTARTSNDTAANPPEAGPQDRRDRRH
jgi:4-amino-4-deoxy-L-arabinose transferase-like glycosyltransferase